MNAKEAREELLRLLQTGLSPFPYDRAGLALAAPFYPELDVDRYLSRLDGLAEDVARHLAAHYPLSGPRERLSSLRRVVFEEHGFRGDTRDYYDIRNCFLNEVLDRKQGMPITLAVMCLGISSRLGWPLEPVSFPAHFLLSWPEGEQPYAVDPFHGGLLLGDEDLDEMWTRATANRPPSRCEMLRPASPPDVMLRMLNNTRQIYQRCGRYGDAARVAEQSILVRPDLAVLERDLGYLCLAAGRTQEAASHLARYLSRSPAGADAARVKSDLERIRKLC